MSAATMADEVGQEEGTVAAVEVAEARSEEKGTLPAREP